MNTFLGLLLIIGFFTWPLKQKTRVPLLFSVPNEAYQSGPLRKMDGSVESVSQLLITVGPPYRPTAAGKGGLRRG